MFIIPSLPPISASPNPAAPRFDVVRIELILFMFDMLLDILDILGMVVGITPIGIGWVDIDGGWIGALIEREPARGMPEKWIRSFCIIY